MLIGEGGGEESQKSTTNLRFKQVRVSSPWIVIVCLLLPKDFVLIRNLASAAMYFPCKLLLTFSQLDSLEQINMANTKYIQCSSKYCCFFLLCYAYYLGRLSWNQNLTLMKY